jgi:hypothetical protein
MGASLAPQPGQGPGQNTNGGAPTPGQGPTTGSYVVAATPAGGTGGADTRDSHREESPREQRAQGSRDLADRFVERFGNERAAITALAGELYDAREDRRRDRDRLAQLPPAGAVVLVGADVEAWNGYRALGLAPDKAKERLELATRLETANRQQQVGTVAEQSAAALGWGGAAVLGELVTDKGLELELRDTIVTDGKGKQETRKMPYARKAGEANAPFVPLSDYVTQKHPGYLPALTVKPATQGAPGTATHAAPAPGTPTAPNTTPGTQGAPGVIVLGDQTPAPGAGGADAVASDPVARLLAANAAAHKAPNVLRPKPAT